MFPFLLKCLHFRPSLLEDYLPFVVMVIILDSCNTRDTILRDSFCVVVKHHKNGFFFFRIEMKLGFFCTLCGVDFL